MSPLENGVLLIPRVRILIFEQPPEHLSLRLLIEKTTLGPLGINIIFLSLLRNQPTFEVELSLDHHHSRIYDSNSVFE